MLLRKHIKDKFVGQCLTRIVNEAFINSLPFNEEAIHDNFIPMNKYVNNVMNTMDTSTILDRAIEANIDNPSYTKFLTNLKNNINQVAEEAAIKIIKNKSLSDSSSPEIIKMAKMDENDIAKLEKAAKKSGIDSVAKIVNDKVIKCIKDEKDAYDKAEGLKQKIKDMIDEAQTEEEETPEVSDLDEELDMSSANGSDEGSPIAPSDEENENSDVDASLDSYFNIVLDPTDARHHISFFSKLQDVCLESILHSTEVYDGEIPYNTLTYITLESTFDFFDSSKLSLDDEINQLDIMRKSSALESIHCPPDMDYDDYRHMKIHDASKTAYICSICILTLLEVLKTMHLQKIESQDVKRFVHRPTLIIDLRKKKLDDIEDKIDDEIIDTKKSVALGSLASVEASIAKENLTNIKNKINGINVGGNNSEQRERIINKLNNGINYKITTESNNDQSGYYISKAKNNNISSLKHAINLIEKMPIVESLQLNIFDNYDVANENVISLEMVGFDKNGTQVQYSEFNINAYPEFGHSVGEIVQECASYITPITNKPKKIKYIKEGYTTSLAVNKVN